MGPRKPGQVVGRDPGRQQSLLAVGLGLSAAHGADVPAARASAVDDGRLVELDVVGQDRDRIARAEADLSATSSGQPTSSRRHPGTARGWRTSAAHR